MRRSYETNNHFLLSSIAGLAWSASHPEFLCINKAELEHSGRFNSGGDRSEFSMCSEGDLIFVRVGVIEFVCDLTKPIVSLEPQFKGEPEAYCYYRGSLRKVRDSIDRHAIALEAKRTKEEFDELQKKLQEIASKGD